MWNQVVGTVTVCSSSPASRMTCSNTSDHGPRTRAARRRPRWAGQHHRSGQSGRHRRVDTATYTLRATATGTSISPAVGRSGTTNSGSSTRADRWRPIRPIRPSSSVVPPRQRHRWQSAGIDKPDVHDGRVRSTCGVAVPLRLCSDLDCAGRAATVVGFCCLVHGEQIIGTRQQVVGPGTTFKGTVTKVAGGSTRIDTRRSGFEAPDTATLTVLADLRQLFSYLFRLTPR